MKTVSGCFGNTNEVYPINHIDEVDAAVEEIIETVEPGTEQPAGPAPDFALAQLIGQYIERVRLLTWAVAIIVIVLVVREVKD